MDTIESQDSGKRLIVTLSGLLPDCLKPEEDPGPGTVIVRLSSDKNDRETRLNKRDLASHSLYFRSQLVRFLGGDSPVELKPDYVTPESWRVIKKMFLTGQLELEDDYNLATHVLHAANFLQMDRVQKEVAQFIKKFVTKTNFVITFNFAAARGISSLSAYITSTIIKPDESVRRRKYGEFDLCIRLGQLDVKCHKSALVRLSPKACHLVVKGLTDIDRLDVATMGISPVNYQLFYNVLETAYTGHEESSPSYCCDEIILILKLLQALESDEKLLEPYMNIIVKLVDKSNYIDIYKAGCEMHISKLKNISLMFLIYSIQIEMDNILVMNIVAEDLVTFLSHNYLNVTNEFIVADFVCKWLTYNITNISSINSVAFKLYSTIRWSLLSSADICDVKNRTVVLENPEIMDNIDYCIANRSHADLPRKWPELLILVEKPQNRRRHKDVSKDVYRTTSTVQAYDFPKKIWTLLSVVPLGLERRSKDKETKMMDWSNGYQVTVTAKHLLVLTSPHSDQPYLPMAQMTYNLWTDSWSKVPRLCSRANRDSYTEHCLVSTHNGKIVALLTPKVKPGDVSDVTLIFSEKIDDNSWTVTNRGHHDEDDELTSKRTKSEPIGASLSKLVSTGQDNVHVIGQLTLYGSNKRIHTSVDSYCLSSGQWGSRLWLEDDDLTEDSSWIDWVGRGLVRIGGRHTHGREMECKMYPLEGGGVILTALASMVRPRVKPGVVVCKGLLFAGGGEGKKPSSKTTEKKSGDENNSGDETAEKRSETSAASVEYYSPELDCWQLLPSQPTLRQSNVELMVIDKPIRMML